VATYSIKLLVTNLIGSQTMKELPSSIKLKDIRRAMRSVKRARVNPALWRLGPTGDTASRTCSYSFRNEVANVCQGCTMNDYGPNHCVRVIGRFIHLQRITITNLNEIKEEK
jgi:hypothetical protein